MQEYRSGHNEAVLKTVWVKAHGGSNPSSCAKKIKTSLALVLFFWNSEGSTVLRIIGGSRAERETIPPCFTCLLASDNTLTNVNLPLPAPKKHGHTPVFSLFI